MSSIAKYAALATLISKASSFVLVPRKCIDQSQVWIRPKLVQQSPAFLSSYDNNENYNQEGYGNYDNQGYDNQGYDNQGYANQGYDNQGNYANQPNQGGYENYDNQGNYQNYDNQGYNENQQTYENYQEEEPKLITENIQENLTELSRKYPTSAIDYLAAARKRAELKVESQNTASSDADWATLADEKVQSGEPGGDGWDASMSDEESQESSIIIPMNLESAPGSEGDDDEPKLLLF